MNELDKDTEGVDRERAGEPWPSPGRILRELRESRGMTQSQVGESLHLTLHYINALENDLYQKLPGKIFAKGYLKSYAALLGADADEIIARFERLSESHEESQAESRPQIPQQRRAGDQNKRWMMGAAVLLVAGLAVAWWFGGEDAPGNANRVGAAARAPAAQQPPRQATAEALINGSRTQEPAAEALPAPAEQQAAIAGAGLPPAETAAAGTLPSDAPVDSAQADTGQAAAASAVTAQAGDAQAGGALDGQAAGGAPDVLALADDPALAGLREEQTNAEGERIITLDTGGDDLLVLQLSGTSWVEVDNGENVRLYNDNLHAGDQLTIRGLAPFNVLLGNAPMVELEFNSQAVDPAASMRRDNSARLVLEP